MRRFAAVLTGLVFFLSGMMKLVDPVGTGLIIGDYFRFFHLGFLTKISLETGVFISCLEALCGVALITGVWRKAAAVLSSVMLLFFTIITVILAVKNPPMDCGCFGEVIHLTHFQTLLKNIVLIVLAAAAFIPFSSLGKPKARKYLTFYMGTLCVGIFIVFSLTSLPVVDYTEMKPGSVLFGDVPLLSLSDTDGEYCEEEFMDTETLAIVVNDPVSLGTRDWERAERAVSAAESAGFSAAIFTASTPGELASILSAALDAPSAMDLYSRTYFADRRKLLTLNRSNAGMVYLSEGTVIRKWHSSKFPDEEELAILSESVPLEEMVEYSSRGKLFLRASLAACLAVLLFI